MKIKFQFQKKIMELYRKIITSKVIKGSIYLIGFIFLPGLLISGIIAYYFGPHGYSIIHNYISHLGSIRFTPAPYILDALLIIFAIASIPVFSFLAEILLSMIKEEYEHSKKITVIIIRIITYLGLFFFIIGAVGSFGLGVFSVDRSIFRIHFISAFVFFMGFSLGAFLVGLIILFFKTIFPKAISLFMIVGTPGATFLLYNGPYFYTIYFIEWLILINIIIWLIPVLIILFKQVNLRMSGEL